MKNSIASRPRFAALVAAVGVLLLGLATAPMLGCAGVWVPPGSATTASANAPAADADGYRKVDDFYRDYFANTSDQSISSKIKFCDYPYMSSSRDRPPAGFNRLPSDAYYVWFGDQKVFFGIPLGQASAFEQAVQAGASPFGRKGLVCFWLDPQPRRPLGDDVFAYRITQWKAGNQ